METSPQTSYKYILGKMPLSTSWHLWSEMWIQKRGRKGLILISPSFIQNPDKIHLECEKSVLLVQDKKVQMILKPWHKLDSALEISSTFQSLLQTDCHHNAGDLVHINFNILFQFHEIILLNNSYFILDFCNNKIMTSKISSFIWVYHIIKIL